MILKPTDYQCRRQKIFSQIKHNSAVIIESGQAKVRCDDVYYPFRANSDFLYLFGINEPNITALIKSDYLVLFFNEKTANQIIWEGQSLTYEIAIDKHGANLVFSLEKLTKQLPKQLINIQTLIYDIGCNPKLDQTIHTAIASISQNRTSNIYPVIHHHLAHYVAEMRLFKDEYEINCIQNAIDVSIKAHQQAMKQSKYCQFEYEVQAIFDKTFTHHGLEHAYPPIVASGQNACILHYIKNDQLLKSDDLMLIDAGCEYHGYASDITNTFPINGQFNQEQAIIYQLILEAQQQAIKTIKPGISVHKPHQIATQVITEGLKRLGLLSTNSPPQALKQFFMHGTGHWLGLNVHDVGAYKINGQYRTFDTGMITTIEPGIYIHPAKNVDAKWWGIGMRIEDDILVTQTSHKNLSQNLIRNIDDIQNYIS